MTDSTRTTSHELLIDNRILFVDDHLSKAWLESSNIKVPMRSLESSRYSTITNYFSKDLFYKKNLFHLIFSFFFLLTFIRLIFLHENPRRRFIDNFFVFSFLPFIFFLLFFFFSFLIFIFLFLLFFFCHSFSFSYHFFLNRNASPAWKVTVESIIKSFMKYKLPENF